MKEPVKCTCGGAGILEKGLIKGRYVQCDEGNCWSGPWKSTKQEAINAWNKLMEVK